MFNEIHVNAHVRTYELYSYVPSFRHNDFFFSIQNEIDIIDPRQKYNRLVFLLFQNDDLTKNRFLQF